jgi:assimilatory nitrate reductase catalytic subunit
MADCCSMPARSPAVGLRDARAMTATGTRTTCPYCGVGCGVVATPLGDGTARIEGDTEHPANFGRLCSKGAALGETLSLDDRLLRPHINGEPSGWDAALDLIASRFTATIAEHGPESVALYVSGQILTEDYYAANKLMKGFIGTANIDTNSRLCMASSVAGHKRAFGADTVPGVYADLEMADLVVLVGSNLAWCHPVLFQRLAAAKQTRGTRVIVIDPRRTATCEIADQHLALAPGSDVALFNGLLAHLTDADALDRDFIAKHTTGFGVALGATEPSDLGTVASVTGLDEAAVADFYRAFRETIRVVTVYSQGVNQSSAGTDKVNAIINCHLATGRIGQPGQGPFSVTGQPNAMGGREVGGLATMLAAHMDLQNADHRRIVQDFWGSPRIADRVGLKAVDMFDAVASGKVKAIWIMGTNPVDSMPYADRVRQALADCPFVVVSEVSARTDTLATADVALPALAWGEKSGTVTNSERRISRQRSFLAHPGEARADWWAIAAVARRMGFVDAFNWADEREVFAEYARLSGTCNAGRRDFDISAHGAIDRSAYDALAPFQWPAPAGAPPQPAIEPHRFFGDGQFYTDDRRARFVPTPARRPQSQPSTDYPLVLNTGRIRDQWHTMTRTSKTPRLMSHIAEPFVEIHPRDAARFGIKAADLVEIESPAGRVTVRALITDRVRPGDVFAPIHWTDQIASNARIDALIAAHPDPVSGQPELKYTPVRVRPSRHAWYAFAVSAKSLVTTGADYWAVARTVGGWRAELAGRDVPADWTAAARRMLGIADTAVLVVAADVASRATRIAAFEDDQYVGGLFVASAPVAVARSWIVEQLGRPAADDTGRASLVAGRPGAGVKDKGQIVCSCFAVGRNEILEAMAAVPGATVDRIGAETRAGTNCGSCRSEIAALIGRRALAVAG